MISRGGLVDGVLYIFGELTDRGRHVQLLKNLKSIQDETTAIELVVKKIEEELDYRFYNFFP